MIDSHRVHPKQSCDPINQHLNNGLLIGDKMANEITKKVLDAITVIETVKKIPQYNANMSLELAFSCVWM